MPLIRIEFSLGDKVVDRSNYYDDSGVIKNIPNREGVVSCIELTPTGTYYTISGKGGKWKLHENSVRSKEYTTTRNNNSRVG